MVFFPNTANRTDLRSPPTLPPLKMHFFQVLITLGSVASVSAIDGYLHWLNACTGSHIICRDLQPERCCNSGRASDSFGGIAFRAIPTDWRVVGEAHYTWDCTGSSAAASGAPNICHSIKGWVGSYGAAKYYFPGKKRRDETGDSACTPVRPNAIGLANGTQYDLGDLPDASFYQMVCIESKKCFFN
jgi:hypothetical protein